MLFWETSRLCFYVARLLSQALHKKFRYVFPGELGEFMQCRLISSFSLLHSLRLYSLFSLLLIAGIMAKSCNLGLELPNNECQRFAYVHKTRENMHSHTHTTSVLDSGSSIYICNTKIKEQRRTTFME